MLKRKILARTIYTTQKGLAYTIVYDADTLTQYCRRRVYRGHHCIQVSISYEIKPGKRMGADTVNPMSREAQKARKDTCFISEIINDLNKIIEVTPGHKFGTMLLDWQSELMGEAGFVNIEEVQAYHATTVGAENW